MDVTAGFKKFSAPQMWFANNKTSGRRASGYAVASVSFVGTKPYACLTLPALVIYIVHFVLITINSNLIFYNKSNFSLKLYLLKNIYSNLLK